MEEVEFYNYTVEETRSREFPALKGERKIMHVDVPIEKAVCYNLLLLRQYIAHLPSVY